MAKVWGLNMSPTNKLVLLALADCADDAGKCWPSVATLAAKCCLSKRSVLRAIDALENDGFVSPQKTAGKQSVYLIRVSGDRCQSVTSDTVSWVTPCQPMDRVIHNRCQSDTGDNLSLVTESHHTGDTVSPHRCQSVTSTGDTVSPVSILDSKPSSKPSINHHKPPTRVREQSSAKLVLPDWLPEATWNEFVAHRKAIKKPMTNLAESKTIKELDRLRAAGNDPVAVIEQSILRGWAGVFDVRRTGPPGKISSVFSQDFSKKDYGVSGKL